MDMSSNIAVREPVVVSTLTPTTIGLTHTVEAPMVMPALTSHNTINAANVQSSFVQQEKFIKPPVLQPQIITNVYTEETTIRTMHNNLISQMTIDNMNQNLFNDKQRTVGIIYPPVAQRQQQTQLMLNQHLNQDIQFFNSEMIHQQQAQAQAHINQATQQVWVRSPFNMQNFASSSSNITESESAKLNFANFIASANLRVQSKNNNSEQFLENNTNNHLNDSQSMYDNL